jgi:hypothetical protein
VAIAVVNGIAPCITSLVKLLPLKHLSKGSTRPIRFEAKKTRQKRKKTESEWFEANPPDENGHWHCYIPKHPQCPKALTRQTIVLEHNLSKARRKDLRYDIKNIFPACEFDNRDKGSMSAAEYLV